VTGSEEYSVEGLIISEQNILVKLKAETQVEVIRKLGGLLYENGYVKDTFVQAVLDREEIFPTGLQTTLLGFAIPHTDTEHVVRPAVAIATLEQPVVFQAMGTPDLSIPVEIVMMLAISDPAAVVRVLRSVISILENEPALQALTLAGSEQEIKEIVGDHIRTVASRFSSEATTALNH
jgi:PTS system galactitol-specific IIA component